MHIPLQEVKYLIAVVYIEHDTQREDERESLLRESPNVYKIRLE